MAKRKVEIFVGIDSDGSYCAYGSGDAGDTEPDYDTVRDVGGYGGDDLGKVCSWHWVIANIEVPTESKVQAVSVEADQP